MRSQRESKGSFLDRSAIAAVKKSDMCTVQIEEKTHFLDEFFKVQEVHFRDEVANAKSLTLTTEIFG